MANIKSEQDYINFGQELLKEWYLYRSARPKAHIFDIQRDKDLLQQWADFLQITLFWENDQVLIQEACCQFEVRLKSFKEKIVIEILTGGAA